jgi:hypothetical protein
MLPPAAGATAQGGEPQFALVIPLMTTDVAFLDVHVSVTD